VAPNDPISNKCDMFNKKELTNKNSLNEHMKIHFQIRFGYSKGFIKPCLLKQHERSIHANISPIIVQLVGILLEPNCALKVHMRSHSDTPRPFKCGNIKQLGLKFQTVSKHQKRH
jgi:hypothetical protein